MKKIVLFSILISLFFLSLFVFADKVLAGYCGLYGCEADEDCNSCEADCGPCDPPPLPDPSLPPGASPPPGNGRWVPCGTHICPNLVEWVSYSCYPSCDNPQYCQDDEPCTGDVPPGVVCYDDADCFPNNCWCAGGIPCDMKCIGNQCISNCGPEPPPGNGNGGPSGSINCNPTSLRVCPPDSTTGTTTVSWSTQNMSTAQVWRCMDDDCDWTDEVLWRTGASGTRNFNNVQSNHSYSFRLYAYDTHGIPLGSCQVLGLCPTCTVILPYPIVVSPEESVPVEAMVSVQKGSVNRVQFIIDDSNIASINPTTVSVSPYITTVSSISDGATILNARVYLDPGDFLGCTDTASVEVRPPGWFQTKEGDVHAEVRIDSRIPPIPVASGEFFCLDGDGETPGIISYGSDYDFKSGFGRGEEFSSSTRWLVNTNFSKKSFNYFYQLLGSPEEDYGGGLPVDPGIYYTADPLAVDNWNVPNGRKIVILVDNEVNINGNVDVALGGFLAIISSGKIKVTETVPQVEGVFITDKEFEVDGTGTESDIEFRGEGIFIAGSFGLGRDLGNLNETTPAESFVHRPDLILNSPPEIWVSSYSWQELPP